MNCLGIMAKYGKCPALSKKTYQLGIAKIVYIEPYPGISVSHVINSGVASPEMKLFSGAVGPAYHKLYEPFLPYKDELSVFFPTKESTESEPPLETEDFLIA